MTMAQEKPVPATRHRWISWLAEAFDRFSVKRRARLDIRELSPHLQRDMGFLDGNDPCGRRQ
ncbi:conserved hypothetical protein [Mesorhizobium sp. STM 4661]|nr:conserved hypothetical protein [Mesorhizobium sp. STM 4661]